MKSLFKIVATVAVAIATSTLLTQSGLPSPGGIGNEKELAQLTDDDYDVGLEDPVIDDGEPTTWQDFAEDARKGESSNVQPTILGPEFGSATLPGDAYLIE